ncbi:MAG TPA: hypothetical protein VG826_18035 [Pirellulales bacterium]|nr:hypothetical protein [Pirellulales bacterium]
MKIASFILVVAVVTSSGCSLVSGFHRDWHSTCCCANRGDVGGCWQGCWDSQCSGHTGNLKAIISRQDACHYEARFRGTFFKVIPFQYRMTLTAVPHEDHYDLHGEKDLGRLLGVYRFRGYATPKNFVAHYTSKDDQGRFLMSRK